ncbi:hypothetical protein [Brasilonema sp. UFV-L1]|uniref:hypothetical protein n=1 Tax=Brasilonema sp. UFV-L1 TaxID=2234130 RepID=UPI00145E9A2F|nr:hypothetical protein [Brasilonema sp. UFV-L1]NMG09901.1 hypothetical protein [Brasilonema sp. UFV-L1]
MGTIETKEFTINANNNFLNSTSQNLFNTNLALKEGDLLTIDSNQRQPNFNSKNTTNRDFEFSVGSLVGTLNGGKTFFPVGNHLKVMVLDEGGNLSFVFWGSDNSADSTAVTVTVEVERGKAEEQAIATSKETEPAKINFDDFPNTFPFAVHSYANSLAWYASNNYYLPEPLLNTAIELQPGDLLTVDVSPRDLWSQDTGERLANANGRIVGPATRTDIGKAQWSLHSYKGHNYREGSLAGSLDGGKTFFPVGVHLEMTVLSAGTLSLCCWDRDTGNNRSFITAYVKVVRNGVPITNLNIKTVISTGNGSNTQIGTGTSSGTEIDDSTLDCSTNLLKLNTKLKSDLSASK